MPAKRRKPPTRKTAARKPVARKTAARKRSGDIRVPTTATNYDVTYKGPPSYRPPRYPKPLIETNAFIFKPTPTFSPEPKTPGPKGEPFRHERIGRPTPPKDTFSPEINRTPLPPTPPITPQTTTEPPPPSTGAIPIPWDGWEGPTG